MEWLESQTPQSLDLVSFDLVEALEKRPFILSLINEAIE